jgi:hypothetical protein
MGGSYTPSVSPSSGSSNDSILSIVIPKEFTGQYSIDFPIENIFPGQYKLTFRGCYRPGGLIRIYVNNGLVGQFDTYKFNSSIKSITGEWFRPEPNGFNRIDFLVKDLVTDFGEMRLKIEYAGPGDTKIPLKGLNFDYIDLEHYKDE